MRITQICAIEIIPQSSGEANTAVPGTAPSAGSTPTDTGPTPAVSPVDTVLKIDANKITGKVIPMLYGLMTEEINFAYEGGLYGELIRQPLLQVDAVVPRVSPDTYEPEACASRYLP